MKEPRGSVTALAVGALAALFLWTAPAGAELDRASFVPLDEVRPGDRCVGKTVFSGSEVEEFGVEILGVVRGVSPGSDLIIARAEGEILEHTGILQGMSGSPVYLDGRLVGAIASSWPFSKDPIAGITPIGEMLPALEAVETAGVERPDAGGAYGASLIPSTERALSRIWWVSGLAGIDGVGAAPAAPVGVFGGREMTAMPIPLVISGGDEEFIRRLAGLLGSCGLTPVRGSARAADEATGELEPGSALGVQFVGGDASWTAIGTVTHREGDRIVAFGHPIFNAGAVEMPMVGAYVHTLLPLASFSFKYASGTELVGAVVGDRRRAVAGRIGPAPSTMPLRVKIRSGEDREALYEFQIIPTRPYSSLFAGLVTGGAVSEAVKTTGPASIDLRAVLKVGDDVIRYDTVFYTSDPALRCAGELAALMDVVMENAFEPRVVRDVELAVTIREAELWNTVERVDVDRPLYRPGDVVRVGVTLRDRRGGTVTETMTLRIPASMPDGSVVLRVGDASSFHEREAGRLGPGLRPRSYAQLLGLIERSKSGNTVVAQLLSARPGFSLSGSEMRDVPGRAALAMSTAATSGTVDPVELSVMDQSEFTADSEVRGCHEVTLFIKADK